MLKNITQSASSRPTKLSQPTAGRQGLISQLRADRWPLGHVQADYWPGHVAPGAVGAASSRAPQSASCRPIGQLLADRERTPSVWPLPPFLLSPTALTSLCSSFLLSLT